MIAVDLPAETMFLNTYHPQEQQVVAGGPPLSTLAAEPQLKWLKGAYPAAHWESVRAELDAPNNAISTVHSVTTRKSAGTSPHTTPGITAHSMIVRAQTVTGLSLKDLAMVYGVSRQTLYNYKKQTDQPNGANWRRLQQIDKEVAALELILPASPGALAKRFANEQGETLLSLLQQKSPDFEQLTALAKQLAEQMNSAAPARQHQTTLDELTRHC